VVVFAALIQHTFVIPNAKKSKMPTIEIISLDSTRLDLNQVDYNVAIIVEDKPISHRGLFYDFLLTQNGIIVHIGNPDMRQDKESGFFAGQIVDWKFEDPGFKEKRKGLKSNQKNSWANQDFIFRFLPKYKTDIRRIMKSAIDNSPRKTIYFLTDYQFGPEKGIMQTVDNLKKFWELHDRDGLAWNSLYKINMK
jgi:hypothetical protein